MACNKFAKFIGDFSDVEKLEKNIETVAIGETCYRLNKSKTKLCRFAYHVTICYGPRVTMSGNKGNFIVFNEK